MAAAHCIWLVVAVLACMHSADASTAGETALRFNGTSAVVCCLLGAVVNRKAGQQLRPRCCTGLRSAPLKQWHR